MKQKFELIITIVNHGFSDLVMSGAKSAGAQGGTIINARGTGIHETTTFFGITIQPEKELVIILVKKELRQEIMEAIRKSAGLSTEGKGLAFSLPVDDVVGIVHLFNENEKHD